MNSPEDFHPRAANKNVDVFNRDASSNEGYLYTKNERLSCHLATQRSTDAILATGELAGRSILDMGCGDGFYSIRFWDLAKPKSFTGIDSAESAIAVANVNKGARAIQFAPGDAHRVPFEDDSFDLALIQSILHHDDHPQDIIREAFRVAPVILIHEPNGNNAGLKVIERLSPYHREHNEKSYSSTQLARWIEEVGGRVTYQKFAGFVPMFSPAWLARLMKIIEPVVEKLPVVNSLGCAVIVNVAERKRDRVASDFRMIG
jgi:ubiquinone/menaquinone biosynthesis C-methylase UbiE